MLELKTDKMLAEKADGIGWMTFNNPARRNATSLEMWQAIADILEDFAADVDAIGYGSNQTNYFTFHQMGTARMGSDPATSVVGPENEAHDTVNLFVMDGSCFPTASGINPMLSIAAVAHRGASQLAERMA